MNKIFTFLVLAFAMSSALAGACTPYYDAEGFERFKCDPEKLAAAFIADMEQKAKSSQPTIKVYWPNDPEFVIYDETNKVVKHCRKRDGWVSCF